MSGEADLLAATLRACSACAGDYEDPERTAWTEELAGRETEDEEGPTGQLVRTDFPVQSNDKQEGGEGDA